MQLYLICRRCPAQGGLYDHLVLICVSRVLFLKLRYDTVSFEV